MDRDAHPPGLARIAVPGVIGSHLDPALPETQLLYYRAFTDTFIHRLAGRPGREDDDG